MLLRHKKIRIFIGAAIFLAALFLSANIQVLPAQAGDILGQNKNFFVNSEYDKFNRTQISATLAAVSEQAYFFIEDIYWNGLSFERKEALISNIAPLAGAFDNDIYPKEREFWGSEPNPGVDGDSKITIVVEQLVSGNGGYFDTLNGYDAPESNKREMFFVSAAAVQDNLRNAKIFLAHEFQHLVSFNQKDIMRNISEDVWLNELRSEYSVTIAGFNEPYAGSGLERRAELFMSQPSDSLTEWPNSSLDYAQAALFGEYLVEQYGSEILKDTLRSSAAGIVSINQFLADKNYKERFGDVFGNWAIANYLNSASVDKKYAYTLSGIQRVKVNPASNVYLSGASYNFYETLKPWQANWHKFNVASSIMDSKAIKIDFAAGAPFKFYYVDNLGRTGALANPAYIDDPGGLADFTLIPVNQSKTSDFSKNEQAAPITFSINFVESGLGRRLSIIENGSLIKKPREGELYVIEGKYKRYLSAGALASYGHLDPTKAIEVDEGTLNSYTTANYVRALNDKKVYAVWPDGTKHWLNMSGEYFTQSGRDWGSIFTINDAEFQFYKTGPDIVK